MKSPSCRKPRRFLAVVGAITLMALVAPPLDAQAPEDVNRGAIRFKGGLDAPTVFVFRGIVQEGDPRLTLFPYGEIGIALSPGNGSSGDLRLAFGVWNSLNTGSSGTGGPLKRLHYAEHFYATLAFGLPAGLTVAPSFRAITSPNGGYHSVREIDVSVSKGGAIAPYGFLAFELSDKGQLDDGAKKGNYLEMGVAPNFGLPFARARLAVPVKAGFSLNDYYELFGNDLAFHDHRFGFFDIGAMVTAPLSVPARFGRWNVHGGVDFLAFGDTTKAFNAGDARKTVGTVGVGLTY